MEQKTDPQPDGPQSVHLVKELYNEKIDKHSIENMLTLTEEQVDAMLNNNSNVRAGIDWGI